MPVRARMLTIDDLDTVPAMAWEVLNHEHEPGARSSIGLEVLPRSPRWPASPARFRARNESPVTLGHLHHIVCSRLGHPFVRAVHAGGQKTPTLSERLGQLPAPGVLDLAAVHEHRSTVIVQHLDWLVDEVRRAAHGLARWTHCLVSVNAYLSPPGSQGLAPHFDAHGVLVLQIDGKKLWRLHHQVVIDPDADMTSDSLGLSQRELAVADPVELFLEEGDLLWLPAGYVHEAQATEATSTHLTFSFQPLPLHQIEGLGGGERRHAGPGFIAAGSAAGASTIAQWWALWGMHTTSPRLYRPGRVYEPETVRLHTDGVNARGVTPTGHVVLHLGDRVVDHTPDMSEALTALLDSGSLSRRRLLELLPRADAANTLDSWYRLGVTI